MTQDPYTTTELRAALACMSCGRVAAEATHPRDGGPTTFVLARPEDAEYVKRRRCPSCLGSLWVGAPETVTTFHRLPDSEVHPKPGRPRQPRLPDSGDDRGEPCGDCGSLTRNRRQLEHPRCWDCTMRQRSVEAEARYRAVEEILGAAGRPLRSSEIAERLGCNHNRASDLIRLARRHGIRIESVGKAYQLEGVAS